MIRNLKALGLALTALFALSAVAASTASAQTPIQGELTADGPVTLTAEETGGAGANALTAFGATVECSGSIYTGHKWETTPHELLPKWSTTATLTPHYKEVNGAGKPNCVAKPINGTATVDMNGCDYVIHLGLKINNENTYGVTFDIECPDGKEITVTIFHSTNPTHTGTPYCTIHVPEQTGLKGAHAKNTPEGHVGITGTIEGIKLTRTTHGTLLCPTEQTAENGKFDIDVTVSGDDVDGFDTPIEISDEVL